VGPQKQFGHGGEENDSFAHAERVHATYGYIYQCP
jgi:hypothetical protein